MERQYHYLVQVDSFLPYRSVISGHYDSIERARTAVNRVRRCGNTRTFHLTAPMTRSAIVPYLYYKQFDPTELPLIETFTKDEPMTI